MPDTTFISLNLRRQVWPALFVLFLAIFVCDSHATDDVGAILQQIKAENTSPISAPPVKRDAGTRKTSGSQSSKTKQPQAQEASQQEGFSGPIWGPMDKLPKQIHGHGLAGTFMVAGQFEGCLELVAAQDNMNPFARIFIVANKRLDLPDYYYIPLEQREVLTIPSNRPLIFVKKGPLAHYYVHMH